jgi:hypothetical protein
MGIKARALYHEAEKLLENSGQMLCLGIYDWFNRVLVVIQ